MIESLKVYSNSEKKVGFWPRAKMEEIMSKISWESLYENFKSIYPRLSRSSVYFRPFGYMSIVVYFEDGMKMIYDDLRKQAHITAWRECQEPMKNFFSFSSKRDILRRPHNRIIASFKGIHFGKKCILSLLIPWTRRDCVATMGEHFFGCVSCWGRTFFIALKTEWRRIKKWNVSF